MEKGMISKYFSWKEVIYSPKAEKIGDPNLPSMIITKNCMRAAAELDKIREVLGPIKVNSWYRSPAVNKAVGGSETSAHLLGWAIDIVSPGMSAYDFACAIAKLDNIEYDQLIHEYDSWVHISFDPRKRAQKLTKFDGPYKSGLLTRKQYFS